MAEYVFFGGKGGVGKTTVASAYALKCARAGLDTLVVSTDPAHSTSDVFDQEFGDDPRPVEGIENLRAMEIDPETEVQEHLQETKRALGDQLSPSMVGEIDLQIEMAHRTPGAYEAALLDRFIDVMREADCDRVVFDTSPTGSTLRLLSLPDLLEKWIDRLVYKREKSIDYFEMAAVGKQEPRRIREGDPILARLERRKERFAFAGEALREASFYLVCTPDELSVRETERSLSTHREYDLSVAGVVINKRTPAPEDDEEGRGARFLREKVATERERIDEMYEAFDAPIVGEIETRVREIKGDLLEEVAADLAVDV
ncbi:ArsA family ATPase [Halalkalicoccus sp. NIPERK01]|uniref:ArsA family ATPase n=1 Tax=Halalkalicoccus sp. NIPERK01 TaxID=3053469 RepID=UPI00256E9A78|nr:ArsA family ATPase [Halalkalicoccus sp. NIPERK01]MDL5362992.1 ArsA family ATPase [Halalkalicoccus sp. NIPERK01]